MSQPPSSPYPGSYPPPQQPGQQYGGGYQPPQQPQYGGGYPPAPQQQQPGSQYGGYPEAPQQAGQQYGGGYGDASQQPGQQYGSGYPEAPQQPGYGTPAAPPPKKSKAGKILLIVLAVVVVVCIGGGAAIWFAAKDTVNDVVDATKTRVSAPETLGGRPKASDPQLQSVAGQMEAQMKQAVPGVTSTVGGFYGEPEKKDLVMIFGASAVLADPKKELADAEKSISGELGVAEFKTVEPGPLGGEARCGDGKADDIPVAVCLWADRGSFGMIATYFKSAAEAQKEFAALRGEIEHKG